MSAVYRDYDQATLDAEYRIRATVPEAEFNRIIGFYAEESARARATLNCRLDVAYGAHADERVDVFGAAAAAGSPAPVFVFVHGGYWRMLSQKESAFMARAFAARDVATVAVNYSLAPNVSLDEIVRQTRAALAWTYKNAATFGGDPRRIFIGGSSAGGHLVGMLLAGGWHQSFGVPADAVKGAVALSGLYELEMLLLTDPNQWLTLDAAGARRNSPIHHLPARGCPLLVSYGGSETREFKRQTDAYAAAWRAQGFPVTHVAMDQANHFDLPLAWNDPESALARATFAMIERGAPST
jgi:arylformamidase